MVMNRADAYLKGYKEGHSYGGVYSPSEHYDVHEKRAYLEGFNRGVDDRLSIVYPELPRKDEDHD